MEVVFRQLVPLICFVFLGGPWTLCWARAGFDPTLPVNSHARFLQPVAFRYPTRELSSLIRRCVLDLLCASSCAVTYASQLCACLLKYRRWYYLRK